MIKSISINGRPFKIALTAALGFAITFTFSCSGGDDPYGGSSKGTPVTYDGETYETVVIGTQTWMARNLNYNAEGSKCYGNDPANCGIYGRLYNWATAMALPSNCNSSSCSFQIGAKHKGICPSGWHIPSDAEWQTLVNFAGGNEIAGKKLKAKNGWKSDGEKSGNGTDDYGFVALPGGDGNYGGWWSATENDASSTYDRYMLHESKYVYRYNSNKFNLHSVRCLKD